MASADSKLVLPGDFDANKVYWLEGRTLIAWREALTKDRVLPGPGQRETQTPQGRIFQTEAQPGIGGGLTSGAFYTMRTVVSGDATNGDIYLQGGQVSGWGTPVNEILLYDASATDWQGDPGEVLKMTVTGTGAETSGILNPSFTPSGVSTPAAASSLGSNTFPSSGDLSGKVCQISLGTFIPGGFQPAGVGNIQIAFCWSGYTISRF